MTFKPPVWRSSEGPQSGRPADDGRTQHNRRASLIAIAFIVLGVAVGLYESRLRHGRGRPAAAPASGTTSQVGGNLSWPGRASILSQIKSHLDKTGGRLDDSCFTLADEAAVRGEFEFGFTAGAMEGVLGGGGGDSKTAKRVADLVTAISRTGSLEDQTKLYDLLVKNDLIDYIDPALDRILKSDLPRAPYLYPFIRRLAAEAPDRGAVKFAIALLGIRGGPADLDLIMLLGRHEEFTLYSVVALVNGVKAGLTGLLAPEAAIWDLAKSVRGWGRIFAVERLTNTSSPDIKRWLLLEGYKNVVMNEYLAYKCAVAGNLRAALTADKVDDRLLEAAGDILEALARGGPVETIDDYADAGPVALTFLNQLAARASTLGRYLVVHGLQVYLGDEKWKSKEREKNGWTDWNRREALRLCDTILARPAWKELAREALSSDDESVFWQGKEAARLLGIDPWDACWRRLHEKPLDPGRWFDVVNGASQARMHEAVLYAETVLPLDKIASGPGSANGLGPEFNAHSCLDFIVQNLGQYPGEGWGLVRAALRSPVIRNRNMALAALGEWGRERWPADAVDALKAAEKAEPEAEVKEDIRKVLAGKPLKD